MSIRNFAVEGIPMIGAPFRVTFDCKNNEDSTIKEINLYLIIEKEQNGITTQSSHLYATVSGLNIAKNATQSGIEATCTIQESARAALESAYGESIRIVSGLKTRSAEVLANGQSVLTLGSLLPSGTGLSVVVHSYNPSITNLSAERFQSTESSAPDDEGETVKIAYVVAADEGYDNFSVSCTATDGVDTRMISLDMPPSSGGAVAATLPGKFSKSMAWSITIVMTDGTETVSRTVSVSRAFANMHESGAVTNGKQVGGVCLGGFSSVKDGDTTGKFECYFPAYFYAGIADGAAPFDAGFVEAVGNTASGSYKDIDVSFNKNFSSAPVVVCGFQTASTAGTFGRCTCAATNVTESGFTIRFFNGDSSGRNPNFTWIAIGN